MAFTSTATISGVALIRGGWVGWWGGVVGQAVATGIQFVKNVQRHTEAWAHSKQDTTRVTKM